MDPIDRQIESLRPVDTVAVFSSLAESLRQQLPPDEQAVPGDLAAEFLAAVARECGIDGDAQALAARIRADEAQAAELSNRALHLLRENGVAEEELKDLVQRPPDISQAPVEEMLLGSAALAALVVVLQLEFRARFSRGPKGTKVDLEVQRRPESPVPIPLPSLTAFMKWLMEQGGPKSS